MRLPGSSAWKSLCRGATAALLLIQLATSYLSGGLNYLKVMREIDALEHGQPTTTKPPTMFKGPFL
ncbi:hypothetical protein [Magnetospirillum molischianum]|uniref:Uncharacterized protein n=1 Tax=Magnetospirillum molischianum DSM 120 TaxID=1150626 RepID=H8FWR9_MAGML|nr:hypothetical protein [Magnetospirillum molischianum]CCG42807.1 exported hypothetical protein [Magnetospirillum molischianum DSM 120]